VFERGGSPTESGESKGKDQKKKRPKKEDRYNTLLGGKTTCGGVRVVALRKRKRNLL